MKTLLLSTILGCGLMACSFQSAAQGTNNPGPSLNERFDAKINLVATPDAPAGAKGKAQFRSEVDDEGGTNSLRLQTTGLEPGDYNVRLVLLGGGTVDLGVLPIVDPDGNTNNNNKIKSDSDVEVPADLDPNDVAQIIVAAGGTDLLIGDLADPASKSKAKFSATVPLTAGPAAPDATGTARLKSSTSKGVQKNKLTLIATGVPADTTFTVDVDGVDAGTVTSNSKGKVMVKSIPAEIVNIRTVRLLVEGAEAVRADF
jgi:hypothetical protein